MMDGQTCTIRALSAYIVNGTVPSYGTTCKADEDLVFPVASTLAHTSDTKVAANHAAAALDVRRMARAPLSL